MAISALYDSEHTCLNGWLSSRSMTNLLVARQRPGAYDARVGEK